MASIGKLLLEKEILLESGTNELEILVFRIAEFTCGINVAKVREVLPAQTMVALPKAHASVSGVFQLRDRVIPCVSLRKHLQVKGPPATAETKVILTDFNRQQTAFEVDHVERIHRLSWEKILPVPSLMALSHTPVTAVARIGERLVIMLDFEMIADQVTDRLSHIPSVPNPHQLPRGELRVVLADDSPTVREAVGDTLRASGYTNLTYFENGALAWKWLEEQMKLTGDLAQVADLVISDVEMPQIDGLHLCKRIKEHAQLGALPVLLFSSIVTPDNHKKGQAVGADAQVAKPELDKVVEIADRLIGQARGGKRAGATSVAPPPQATAAVRSSAAPHVSGPVVAAQAALPAAPPDTRLWNTFRVELRDRARFLGQLCRRLDGPRDGELGREIARTLHTIKSAAMVVPVPQVSRVIHDLESLFSAALEQPANWPQAELERVTEWLGELCELAHNADHTLARADAILPRQA